MLLHLLDPDCSDIPLTIVKARNKTSNVSIYGFNVAKVAMEINIV